MTTSLELRPTPPQIIGPAAPAHSFGDLERMAQVIATGGLFPALKNPAQALSLMLLCQAKNLHPMEAVERYHIVQGRPVKRADAMLGDFLMSGGRVEWHERTDKAAVATFSHPAGGSVRVGWTFEQAKAAGLTGKDVWKQYPRQMLHARCVSEGCRSVFPGATDGLYTPEEAQDMGPLKVAPAEVAPPAPAPQVEAQKPKAKPLNIAVRDFWKRADALGFLVRGEDGAVSNDLVCALAVRMLGGEVVETAADWDRALIALDNPPQEIPADAAGVNTDDIGDPFAEDSEPALLAVPADPTPEPVAASPFVDAPIRKGRIL